MLLVSAESIKSHQVRREAETAYEQQKLVVPIRLNISHSELQNVPIFRMVSGTAVSVTTDGTNASKVTERIAASLRKAGFGRDDVTISKSKTAPPTMPLSDSSVADKVASKPARVSLWTTLLRKEMPRSILYPWLASVVLANFVVGELLKSAGIFTLGSAVLFGTLATVILGLVALFFHLRHK